MKNVLSNDFIYNALRVFFWATLTIFLFSQMGTWGFAAVGVLAMVVAKYREAAFRLNYEINAKNQPEDARYI